MDYKALFGVGWRDDVLKQPNYPVLIYFGRKLAIYFEHPGGGAVEITGLEDAVADPPDVQRSAAVHGARRQMGRGPELELVAVRIDPANCSAFLAIL